MGPWPWLSPCSDHCTQRTPGAANLSPLASNSNPTPSQPPEPKALSLQPFPPRNPLTEVCPERVVYRGSPTEECRQGSVCWSCLQKYACSGSPTQVRLQELSTRAGLKKFTRLKVVIPQRSTSGGLPTEACLQRFAKTSTWSVQAQAAGHTVRMWSYILIPSSLSIPPCLPTLFMPFPPQQQTAALKYNWGFRCPRHWGCWS